MPGNRTLYRIVLTNPPTVQDMLSHEALGKMPQSADRETLRLLGGISLYTQSSKRGRKRLASRGEEEPSLQNYEYLITAALR